MSLEEFGRIVASAVEGAVVEVSFDQLTVDVPAERWVDAATFCRDDERLAADFFDWLSAYDDSTADAGAAVAVVVHVWSVRHRHHLRLRTLITGESPRLPSLTDVWAGADWHERETFEMFGVVFDGHPNLVPLLLPDGFEGHPLRKDFVLASRVAKPWPGAKEPGESDRDTERVSARRRMLPPGVPDPATWGPDATGEPATDAAPAAESAE
ncbi:MAG: NADH-quinone oxidoreductase subunit C [Frankiales bacterium]|nr:NADH-quinone oxidoreductase subunit C [Frankiales bacterium]